MGPEDGIIIDEGNMYHHYGHDTSSCSSSDSDTDSDSGSEASWCRDCCCRCWSDWEDECYYETMECCGGGSVGVCGWSYGRSSSRSSGWIGKDDAKRKNKKKKRKKTKKRDDGKGLSFWQKCYPVKKKGDWGGDVVGVSRCPGEVCASPCPLASFFFFGLAVVVSTWREYSDDDGMNEQQQQDSRKWGFQTDHPRSHHTTSVVVRHVCAPGSCCDDGPRSRSRDRVGRRRRMRDRSVAHERVRVGEGERTGHPKRGRRRALIFDEYEAYPREREYRGDAPAGFVREGGATPPTGLVRERSYTPTRIVRERGDVRRGWGSRRRRGGDERDEGDDDMATMHGALVDDRHRGYGGRRERSWKRRSDPDDRIGEIDDRTEHSYAVGERMAAPRREDHGRRIVRFRGT